MMRPNLIDLYYEAADQMVARLGLDVASALQEYEQLKRYYGAATAVDYSNPVRRYAYLKTMAPRHAVIWREYTRAENLGYPQPGGTLFLNSIGAGPAPEVFGFMEGVQGCLSFSRIDIRCLETEPDWSVAGAIAADLYSARTGKDVSLTYVDSVAQLHRGAYTLGSMVISDLVRAGTQVQVLLHDLRQHITPAEGLFLDTTKCRSPDGAEPFTSDYVRGSLTKPYVNFTQRGYVDLMRSAVDKEVASMSRRPEHELSTGFMYNGYHMRF